jgi:2'-5' RNA ligase
MDMAEIEIRDGRGKNTSPGDPQRCFLGFELTGDSRAYLAGLVTPLHEKLKGKYGWPVRLLPDRNWHATLLFFQRLTAGERARVWREVEADAQAGVWADLQFAWSGLAIWPSPRRPNLICLELRDADKPVRNTSGQAPAYTSALQWPLVDRLTETPFSKGETDHLLRYRPHITVMRFRRGGQKPNAGQWSEIQPEIPPIDPHRVRFDHVSLFLSTLSSGNPIYPREYTASLRAK